MSGGPAFSVLFAIGLGITGWGAYCAVKSRRAADWPTVIGTLNSCEIREKSDSDGTTFRVHVDYTYQVAGRQYHGHRIAFGYAGSNKRSEHAALYKKLSAAHNVVVLYNQSDPGDSVLTYGLNLSTVRILFFGLMWLFFVTGFGILWMLPRWSSYWFPVFGVSLLTLIVGAILLWILSRKQDIAILDRIQIR